jgi:ROS/MUCR transcriptional regulator protein
MNSASIKGVQPEVDGRLQCLECGSWYRALGPHLVQGEGMDPDAYRERHGLPATLPLAAADLRARWRHHTKQRRERGELPTAIDPGVGAVARRKAVHRRVETASRPGVRAVHQAGIAKARTRAVSNARAALDEVAAGLGYLGWRDLIARTCHQDTGTLSRITGRDRQTITYWRRKILGPDWKTASGYLHPNRAAAYARIEVEFAARGWTALADALSRYKAGIRNLAHELGTTTPTLQAWDQYRRAGQTRR